MRMFFNVCPDTAQRETRTAIVLDGHETLPPGKYSFIEFYCDEIDCDCRRSIIQVLSEDNQILATLSYGWETRAFYEQWFHNSEGVDNLVGVSLQPMSVQGEHCHQLRDLFEQLLDGDREYASRYPRHYREFKSAIGARRPITNRRIGRPKRKRKLQL